jgi:hypothetical protein
VLRTDGDILSATLRVSSDGVDLVEARGLVDSPADPIRLMPATVREGMRWRSGGITFSVLASADAGFMGFPGRRVWCIERTNDAGSSSQSWVEGIGLVRTDCGFETAGPIVDHAVVVLEPEAPVEDPLGPELELVPAVVQGRDDNVLDEFAGPTWSDSVVSPAGDSAVSLFVTQTYTRPTFDAMGLLVSDSTGARCWSVSAAGWAPGEYEIPGLEPNPALCPGTGDNSNPALTWARADRALVTVNETFWRRQGNLLYSEADGLGIFSPSQAQFEAQTYVYRPGFGYPTTTYDRVLRPIFSPPLDGPEERQHLLLTDGLRLLTGFSDPDGSSSPARLVGGFGERLLARSYAGGHDLFAISPHGTIDTVAIRDGAMERTRLGHVSLAPSGMLVGAFSDANGIHVVTWDGIETTTSVGDAGKLRAWRVDGAPEAGAAVSPAPGFGVSATADGWDVRVCWTVGAGAIDTNGWIINGKPAARVVPEGESCAVVIRDVIADPPLGGEAHFQEPGRWVVEGPVPGVGRVLAVARGPLWSPEVWTPLASLGRARRIDDERLWDELFVYSSAGTRLGRTLADFPSFGLEDHTGAGVWTIQVPTEMQPAGRVLRVGAESLDVAYPYPQAAGAPTLLGPVVIGGMLINAGIGVPVRIDGEGVFTELALPSDAPTMVPAVELADGTLCGFDITDVVCGAPGELAKFRTPAAPNSFALDGATRALVLGDTLLLEQGRVGTDYVLQLLDLTTGERTDLGVQPGVSVLRRLPDGSALGVSRGATDWVMLEVTSEGELRRHRLKQPLALLTNVAGAKPLGLIATEDTLLLEWCGMAGEGVCLGPAQSIRLLPEWFELEAT